MVSRYKIIGAILLTLLIAGLAMGQVKVTDEPIVSDRAVAPVDIIRIVDKDETQRIINKVSDRIQRLENKVKQNEADIAILRSQVQAEGR